MWVQGFNQVQLVGELDYRETNTRHGRKEVKFLVWHIVEVCVCERERRARDPERER